MIEEPGQVVGIEGEYAWVEAVRATSCSSCSAHQGCGTATLARVLGNRQVRLRVLNRIDARIGDSVVIGIPESGLLRGSVAVYAAPLLGLFAGALAGHLLGGGLVADGSDLAAVAGAAAGFAAGLVWLRRFSRRIAVDTAFQPVVLRQQIVARGI
ncbi:MAG: SoxR reducing system RseC family protein [Gammaproteobacteria bacterium]|jgi:sigma-E factor negative regulatory protein RseC